MVNGEDPPPPVGVGGGDPDSDPEPDPALDPKPDSHPDPLRGEQVVAVCPECGGVLTERAEAGVLQRMAQQAEKRGQPRSARRFRRQSQAASEQAEIVRKALAGAAGTTLRRVVDSDEEEPVGVPEEGAA
jgi:Zn-finger nucleic acid-binding protein